MSVRTVLSIVGGLLFAAGYVAYIGAVLRGNAKPSKMSWIIWMSADAITLAGMYVADAVNSQIVMAVVGSMIVVVLAWKHGTPGWTPLDKACFTGAVLAIILWRTFNSPALGIIFGSIATAFGSIPTFKAVWEDPSRESRLAWILGTASCIMMVAIVPAWTVVHTVQPVLFLVLNGGILGILFFRRRPLAAL